VGIDGGDGAAWIWPALLRSSMYGGQNTEVFRCPAAPPQSQWIPKFGSGAPAKLGYLKDEVRLRPGGTFFMSYGYNALGRLRRTDAQHRGSACTSEIRYGARPRRPR
jgi:hypothetical protein